MTDLLSLAEQVERATENPRNGQLMLDAYWAIFGEAKTQDDWRRFNSFSAKLLAEAYESAAMMLVPEGWAWSVESDGTAILEWFSASVTPRGGRD